MITREEYELLIGYRAIGYKWIARDKNKMLYVYSHKPFKENSMRYTSDEETLYNYISYSCRNDVFKSITWEDEQPTKINDLIRDYESHQVITGGNNVNKSELIKEIEEILDDIGVSDYQLGECDEDTIWTISSITIREILSAIEKHSPVSVVDKEKLYTVKLANGDCLYKFKDIEVGWTNGYSNYKNDKDFQLTQSEIESVDPVLMQIAKEVE